MSYHPFRLLSVFVVTLVFALPLSLSFDSDAHGQDGKAEKHYQRAKKFFLDQSYKKAVRFYEKAAKKGHAEAQYYLGYIFRYGREGYDYNQNVPINLEKSFMWLHKSAEQGNALAQYEMSKILRGEYNYESKTREQYGDVEIDSSAAFMWLRKSAEQGNFKAQAELSEIFYRGKKRSIFHWGEHNMPKNYAKAAEWSRKVIDATKNNKDISDLAELREAYAMYHLGEIYSAGGFGVKQDCAQARSWYEMLMSKGLVQLSEMAEKYNSGREKNPCIKKNDKKASDLYLQELKFQSYLDGTTIKALIEMYTEGRGVKKSPSTLYALYLIYANGDAFDLEGEITEIVAGKKAKELRETLTEKQLDEGVRLFFKWKRASSAFDNLFSR